MIFTLTHRNESGLLTLEITCRDRLSLTGEAVARHW